MTVVATGAASTERRRTNLSPPGRSSAGVSRKAERMVIARGW